MIGLLKGHCHEHFFGLFSKTSFFSKTASKLRLSTFNHAGNAPRTQREGYLANCLKKKVTVNSFHQLISKPQRQNLKRSG